MARRRTYLLAYQQIPDEQTAREICLIERKEDVVRVMQTLNQNVPMVKGVRKGQFHNFTIEFEGKVGKFNMVHPSLGFVKFKSIYQFIAWILRQYQ